MAHDGAEHCLEIECRADRLADLAQRFQFPNRPSQLAGPRLQFLEQPHVLDSDHRLISEGFQESNLLFGEWTDLRAPDEDSPDGNPLAQQTSTVRDPLISCLVLESGNSVFTSAARS